MPTKKELIQDHQARLDAAFAELYPVGRFTIQRWNDEIGLYWSNGRETSKTTSLGVGVYQHLNGPIINSDCQNNSFGKFTHYITLSEMLQAARKMEISEEIITFFIHRYLQR